MWKLSRTTSDVYEREKKLTFFLIFVNKKLAIDRICDVDGTVSLWLNAGVNLINKYFRFQFMLLDWTALLSPERHDTVRLHVTRILQHMETKWINLTSLAYGRTASRSFRVILNFLWPLSTSNRSEFFVYWANKLNLLTFY